ncbi:MAG TPA: hypothetical protein DF296_10755 [Candidatus Margulisbacteria bacterium]|nr:hypothetical protein [Candidatus Margulisiibacteriota bacterium]
MDIKTTDLFLSAFLINNQIRPSDIITEGSSKKKVIFLFPETKHSIELTKQFKLGQAVTNVLDLKRNLQHVRDMMFDKLREI